jgi:hypothetical protein
MALPPYPNTLKQKLPSGKSQTYAAPLISRWKEVTCNNIITISFGIGIEKLNENVKRKPTSNYVLRIE